MILGRNLLLRVVHFSKCQYAQADLLAVILAAISRLFQLSAKLKESFSTTISGSGTNQDLRLLWYNLNGLNGFDSPDVSLANRGYLA